MSFLSRWFGPKYDDPRLVTTIEKAFVDDPHVTDLTDLVVTSEKGVVTVTGTCHNDREKDRIEGVARDALRQAGLKFERLVNEIKAR